MGSFIFKWAHPASDVYVTGTFDDWKKSEKLERVGEHFEKIVTLPDASKKIYYKFVVDGNWVTDHTAPKEIDEHGNENNVLEPAQITVEPTAATTTMLSSAAPESTTAALAAKVPLEKKDEAVTVTPVTDAVVEKSEEKEDKSDLPGTFPETTAAEIGINPLPAAAGAVNPVTLAPGEKIPEEISVASTTANVKLDAESYEKSDTLPGGAPFPAPDAPAEATVPEIVKESQEKAHVDPEASAVPEEVEEKAAVEKELLDKVKEAPSTSEGTAGEGTEKTENNVTLNEAAASVAAAATAVAAAAGGAAVAAAVAAKDTVAEKAAEVATTAQTTATEAATNLPEPVKEMLPESLQATVAGTEKEEVREEVSPEVPAEVKESIIEAGKEPEAAANTEAVAEKKAVEAELLDEVKPTKAVDESSKAAGPATEIKAETPVTDAKTETTANESKAEAPATETIATNGASNGASALTDPTTPAKPAEAKASTSSSDKPAETPTKKKKNRLSAIFGKLKDKVSHK